MPAGNTIPSPAPGGNPSAQPQAAAGAQGGDIMSALQGLAASGMFAQKSGKPSNVFMGQYGPLSASPLQHVAGWLGYNTQPKAMTEDIQATINRYYNWTDSEKQDLRNKLALIDKSALTASDSDIARIWGDYAQQSANYVAAGQSVSPWDIISKDIASRGGQAISKAGTKTATTSDTQLTSRIDSDAVFRSAAQTLLGRDPTANESAKFQQLLNAQERANPTTATVSTTTDEEGNVVNTSRTSQGGVSAAGAAELARREALKNPESGAYQAATTYFNAFRQALAS